MNRRTIKVRKEPTRDECLSAIKMTLIRFNAFVQEMNRQNYYSPGRFTAGHRDFLYEMVGRQYLGNMNAVLTGGQLEELDDEALKTVLEKCRRLSDGFGLCVDIPKKVRVADERESARCWTVKKDRDGKTQSIVYGGGNDVLEIFPDGREEYHEYPGNGSRAGFLARYAGLPVLADGTSPLMLNALSENGYSYDEEKKLWIAGENAKKEFGVGVYEFNKYEGLNQKEIGLKTGLDGNKTCLLTCWIDIYVHEGINIEDAYKIVIDGIASGIISTPNSNLNNQIILSDSFSKQLNRDDTKYLQYPWKDGKQVLYDSLEVFYTSQYPYGIAEWTSPGKSPENHHYSLLILEGKKHLDPWPGGINSCTGWEKAKITKIRPLMWSSWRR